MMDWPGKFTKVEAFWKHDGNPKRPYALLTSGKISDCFFNGSRVIERPKLTQKVATDLIAIRNKFEVGAMYPQIVVGPAVGAIPLIHEVARQLPRSPRAWFSEEVGPTKLIIIKRFDNADNLRYALLVEDVITTGKSTIKTIEALQRLDPMITTLPNVLCIVNRSGKTTLPNGAGIIALYTIAAQTWDRGQNPYTPDGQELVEPVRPKANWAALIRV